jgi:hypothetical protein
MRPETTVPSSTKQGRKWDDRGKERKPRTKRHCRSKESDGNVTSVFDRSDVSIGRPHSHDVEENSSTTDSSDEGSNPKSQVRTVKAKGSGENGGTRGAGSSDSEIDENSSDNSAESFSSSKENANKGIEKKTSLSKEEVRKALLAAADWLK